MSTVNVLTIHSYRGGTGKTLLSINLGASYSKKEKVCVFDYDLKAPSLYKIFEKHTHDVWLNDYLNGECDIEDVVVEVYPNMFVGFACPDVEAIRDILGKSRSWETEALKRTIFLRKTMGDMGFDKIIYDTSPGMAYSSINAVVGSDVVALIMRLDALDILGTKEMVKGVYELLDKPTIIVANMVLPEQYGILKPVLEDTFGEQALAYLPCLCEVRSLFTRGKQILIDEGLDYSKAVLKLANDIEGFFKG